MIVTPGAVARLVLLVIFTVAFQISGVQGVNVLGGNADLVPLVVAAVALYAGCIPGAAVGFACGLLVDLVLGQDVGASSLVLTAVGFWVGRYGEVKEPSHGLLPLAVAPAATGGYLIGMTIVTLLLSFSAAVSGLAFTSMLLTVFLNTVIALPVFALIRRIIRPALKRDPLDRHRRRAKPIEAGPIGLRGLGI